MGEGEGGRVRGSRDGGGLIGSFKSHACLLVIYSGGGERGRKLEDREKRGDERKERERRRR